MMDKINTLKSKTKRGAPRGPRNAAERRSALLQSAGKLFVEKGYASTTMDEIAADAGFAKGTLYHYFSNKTELLHSLREEFDKEAVRRIQAVIDTCPANDWHGKIKAWVTGAVQTYFAMSELHDIVIYGSGMPFRNAMADSEVTGHLAQLLAEGREENAWQLDDARWMAVMMFYCFRGSCDEAMVGTLPAEDIPVRLYGLFMRMLGLTNTDYQ